MGSIVQLEDLFAKYPSIDDQNIQEELTRKYEFAELASSPTEPFPAEGKAYNHQTLIQRFMRFYNRKIILHDTGTGKSYLIGTVGEYFHLNRGPRGIKGVIIIVKGEVQELDMKKMLVCKSTNKYYLNDSVINAPNERAAKTNATKSLGEWYTIRKSRSFAKEIAGMSDEQLIDKFSDHLIIIDEIHNLRIKPTLDVMNTPDEKLKVGQRVYKHLHRLTHIPHRIKVMGLSASITINDVNEAAHVMNLVLPMSRQFPVGANIKDATVEQLNYHLRGMVSYVRALDTGIKEIRMGAVDTQVYNLGELDIPNYQSQLKIQALGMSDFQSYHYARAFNIKGEDNVKKIEKLKLDARQASTMVYPDGSWGNQENGGFNKYYKPTGDGWYEPTEELMPFYQNLNQLSVLSTKIAFIVNLCKKSNGIVAIFDELVEGSGLLDVAIALEKSGFTRFNEVNSIFITKDQNISYCQSGKDAKRTVRPEIQPGSKTGRYSFSIIAGPTAKSQIPLILDTVSSYENRNGDYIKVFLYSGKAKEGISVNNMRKYVQLRGLWNPATEYQGKSRGIRSGSHNDLIDDMVEELMGRGYSREEARQRAVIDVEEYFLAAIPNEKIVRENPTVQSVDMMMYRYTEYKDVEGKDLMRKLKILATDCQTHYNRNVRATDLPGTPQCDYKQDCQYKCLAPPNTPETLDYSTYDVYYIDDAVEKIVELIKLYFLKNGSGTIETIRNMISTQPGLDLHTIKDKYIMLALYTLITDRIPIDDRFGYTVYLKEDNGVYYTSRQYPLQNDIYENRSLSFYGYSVITDVVRSFNDVLVDREKEEVFDLIGELKHIDPNTPDYINLLSRRIDDYKVENRTLILEDALYEQINGRGNPYTQAIINIFQRVIFQLNEPANEIARTAGEMAMKGKIVGMTPVGTEPGKIQRINFATEGETVKLEMQNNTEVIYIHSLFSHATERTKYRTVPRIFKAEGRIRIYKPSEGKGWRDTNPYETIVYNKFLQIQVYNLQQRYEQYGIYGIILADGTFNIRDKTTEDPEAAHNLRKFHRSRECKSWDKYRLVDVMWYLQMPKPQNIIPILPRYDIILTDVSRFTNTHINEVRGWPADKIDYYYAWSTSPLVKEQMCGLIKDEMIRRDMILRWS